MVVVPAVVESRPGRMAVAALLVGRGPTTVLAVGATCRAAAAAAWPAAMVAGPPVPVVTEEWGQNHGKGRGEAGGADCRGRAAREGHSWEGEGALA